jgi:hypothetical protein
VEDIGCIYILYSSKLLNFSFYFQSKFYFSFYFNNYQKDYRFIKLLCGYCIEICGCSRVFTPTGSERIGDEVGPFNHLILYRVHLSMTGFELSSLVEIGLNCKGSYKSNTHNITIYIHPMSSTPSNPPHLNSSCK